MNGLMKIWGFTERLMFRILVGIVGTCQKTTQTGMSIRIQPDPAAISGQ